MSELAIAIIGNKDLKGGVYDVLASFHHGLLKGFKQNCIMANYLEDCVLNNLPFNVVITFNCGGVEIWQKIMDNNIYNIMWTVDSVFGHNYKVIEHFAENPKFVLFEVTPADMSAIKYFMPKLQHIPIAHATDEELWQKKDVEKTIDVSFFSSIRDYEKIKKEAIEQMTQDEKKVYLELYEICLNNPDNAYHNVFAKYQKETGIVFDNDTYIKMYNNIVYPQEYEQKIKLVQSLKDFNVKVFGNELWKKYISGKQEYMGAKNVKETIDYMNKSKITLHMQPMTLNGGLHERILNASSTGTFVLSNNNKTINRFFGDNFGYYNDVTFEDAPDIVSYYLQNDSIREKKADISREIVLGNHTWKNRASEILKHLKI